MSPVWARQTGAAGLQENGAGRNALPPDTGKFCQTPLPRAERERALSLCLAAWMAREEKLNRSEGAIALQSGPREGVDPPCVRQIERLGDFRHSHPCEVPHPH